MAAKKSNKQSGLMQRLALPIVVVSTLFTAFGQYFIKKGLNQAQIALLPDILNLLNSSFVFGFALYGIGAVLLIIALKYKKLSVVYPIYALGFIWVALLGLFLLGESLSPTNWAGVVVVVMGVSLIGVGDKHD